MDRAAVEHAAELLDGAWRTGDRLERLPEGSRPASAAEAYAIQVAILARSGDGVAGWKVAMSEEYGLLTAILARSRVFADGEAIPSRGMAMLGVEAEIAFRFHMPLPPRDRPYDRAEVEDAVTAFPAIEIVDTRFRNYDRTPVIERAADFMSNGGFVVGSARNDWRMVDLAGLEASVTIDGVEVVRRIGGHAAGDPLTPAIAFVNAMRSASGVSAGMVVTTGTYTGLAFARADSQVRASFEGFGTVGFRFRP